VPILPSKALTSSREQARAAYCDTFRLLLGFAADRACKPPHTLDIGELDAPLTVAFLNHLERQRSNSIRTRNARLSAIHSLFAYAGRLDATVLQAVLTGWLRARLPAAPAASRRSDRVVIAVGGKVLRATRLPEGRQVHLLSGYEVATGIVLARVAVEAKSIELFRPRAAFC
jgi:hypothetical protein